MAVGMTPLIPLYRVQPDPEARFKRFGSNGSQLIGKPLIEPSQEAKPARSPTPARQPSDAFAQLQEPGGARLATGHGPAAPTTPASQGLAASYQRLQAKAANTGASAPGGSLDLKA